MTFYSHPQHLGWSSFHVAPRFGLVAMAVAVTVTVAIAMAVIVVKMAAVIVVVGVAPVIVMALVMAPSAIVVMLALPVMMAIIVADIIPVGVAVVPAVVRPRVGTTDPVSTVIPSSTGMYEAMGSPAVGVAPIGPGANTEEDSVIEVTRPVEAWRSAGVRRKLVIAVGADGRCADLDAERNLGIGLGREGKKRKRQGRAEKRESSAPEEGFSCRNHIQKNTVSER